MKQAKLLRKNWEKAFSVTQLDKYAGKFLCDGFVELSISPAIVD